VHLVTLTLQEDHHVAELYRKSITILLSVALPTFAVAQTEEHKQPFEAIIKTLEWTSVFQMSHDLVVTYNSGHDTSRGSQGAFREDFLKMRQMHRAKDGAFIIAQCVADSQINAMLADKEPALTETINLSVSHGDRHEGEVLLLNGGSSVIRSTTGRSTLEVACPIDFSSLSCQIYDFSRKTTPKARESFEKMLSAIESLEPKHVAYEEGKVGGKSVSIFRIMYPKRPNPTMQEHEVYKITVSQEGFDKGRILEFQNNLIVYSPDVKYESDSQLTNEISTTCTIHWKEFDTKESTSPSDSISSAENKKLVLPISISKKYKSSGTKKFVNASLDWRAFGSEKLFSVDEAKKICDEYRKDAERAMKR
jgi:hypothetical protein